MSLERQFIFNVEQKTMYFDVKDPKTGKVKKGKGIKTYVYLKVDILTLTGNIDQKIYAFWVYSRNSPPGIRVKLPQTGVHAKAKGMPLQDFIPDMARMWGDDSPDILENIENILADDMARSQKNYLNPC